ncbi:MAG: hypothetical protein R3E87_02255 [Burkholderiaceae bacterium]
MLYRTQIPNRGKRHANPRAATPAIGIDANRFRVGALVFLLLAGSAAGLAMAAEPGRTSGDAPRIDLPGMGPEPGFAEIDKDSDARITREEARSAGLNRLLARWDDADTDHNGFIGLAELEGFRLQRKALQEGRNDRADDATRRQPSSDRQAGAGPRAADGGQRNGGASDVRQTAAGRADADQPVLTTGKGSFKSPETVVWDERRDVYLVSNVNGGLTDVDDNGFISRVAPDGTILERDWIAGEGNPSVVLNGPKGMLLTDRYLIVADVHTVRAFDRESGAPVHEIRVYGSTMLNYPAVGPDGKTLYVTDTGKADGQDGAVYRLTDSGAKAVAQGESLQRPDGLLAHEGGLLVTPFGKGAREVYKLGMDGKRQPFAQMPAAQLDGLLRLPDGSLLVTSWAGNAVYQVKDGQTQTVASGIRSPAQIGYDAKRQRLLVPVLRDDELRIYSLSSES